MDTIYALATARGKAGIAVVRVSGPAAPDSLRRIAGRDLPARTATLCRLADAEGTVIDTALILRFDADRSFTGEDVVEYQLHGSPAVVSALLATLSEQHDHQPAGPGDFTRRALSSGRMDLAQVEGLADLIDAETEAQRRQALAVHAGGVGDLADRWRGDLIRAAALVEATIDFADEDVPIDVTAEVAGLISGVRADIDQAIAGSQVAERLRDGFEVAILGAPNAGKSTLLNTIAGRDVAITSEVAGTTRDVLEVRTDLHGLPVTFLDTAGLRQTADPVEQIGVSRAVDRARGADLRIFLRRPGDPAFDLLPTEADLILHGKSDLGDGVDIGVSGLTGDGVDRLLSSVVDILSDRVAGAGLMSRDRHRHALRAAHRSLAAAAEGLELSAPEEVVAADLRGAVRALEHLVGRVDIEHLLDDIFASFCIGK